MKYSDKYSGVSLFYVEHEWVGQKLLLLCFPNWVPPEQFFAVFSEKTDFLKKLLNLKLFSIKFVIKKVILIFGIRLPLVLKKC